MQEGLCPRPMARAVHRAQIVDDPLAADRATAYLPDRAMPPGADGGLPLTARRGVVTIRQNTPSLDLTIAAKARSPILVARPVQNLVQSPVQNAVKEQ